MKSANKIKVSALFLGDIIALYLALFATLLIRYGSEFYNQFVDRHLLPFTIIFPIWLVIFYIAGLYDLRRLRNSLEFIKTLWLAIFVNVVIAVFFFYLLPVFTITPKTNLFIFMAVFSLLEMLWRRQFNHLISSGEAPNKVLLIGNSAGAIEGIASSAPTWINQLGYELRARLSEEEAVAHPQKLRELVFLKNITLVVVPRKLKNDDRLTRMLYEFLNYGVEIRDVPSFYEIIARKVPLGELEESWFLENLTGQQKFYDPLKRAWEFFFALLLQILLSPFELFMAIVIKLTSPGPVIYKQARVGQHGKEFVFYKFRTMPQNVEVGVARWSAPGDKRATAFGRFLRYTHLDELPQLLNIIKGELSFVGPRPERPEFVRVLKEKIPYYEVRLLVKPGVTGWAQIHHRSDTSHEDVVEKLQYDIYYIKNRSPILDFAIVLKTIKTLFVTPK